MELEGNETFMKYVKIYNMTKNLALIKQKMKAEGQFPPILIDVSSLILIIFRCLWKIPSISRTQLNIIECYYHNYNYQFKGVLPYFLIMSSNFYLLAYV